MGKEGLSKHSISIALSLIVLLALALRITGLFHGTGFHPDERHMVSVTLGLSLDSFEGLNPKSFAYGSLSYYLNRFTAELLRASGIWRDAVSYDNLYIIGRVICIIAGVLTIPLTFALAARVSNKTSGIIAALLLTLNILHLQLSRFFTSDVMLTLFVTLAIYGMVGTVQERKFKWWLVSALGIGLSVGTKFSGILLFIPLLFTTFFLLITGEKILKTLSYSALTVILAVLVCFIAEPFAFLDFGTYWKQVKEQTDMARGLWEPPYTKQYYQTLPFIYPLEQMARYTMGLPVFITVIGGILFALKNILKIEVFILLLWVGLLFFSTGGLLVKYPRYLLPLYPELFVFGGMFLTHVTRWLRNEVSFFGTKELSPES